MTGLKVKSPAGGEAGGGWCGSRRVEWLDLMMSLRLEILSVKNVAKSAGRDGVEVGRDEDCLRCSTLFTVLQRRRGFPRDDAILAE